MSFEREAKSGNSFSCSGIKRAIPRVFVLARPVFREAEAREFLQDHDESWRLAPDSTPAERAVEFAGRICYMSFGARQSPRTTRKYIRNLIDRGHESVLEHVAWTFLLTGVSRSFSHQLVRHRIGFSYSQLSQQYHDERNAETIVPAVIAEDDDLHRLWTKVVSESTAAYKELIDALEQRRRLALSRDSKERLRLIRTVARGILPANIETKIVVTANARALRHFLSLRGGLLGDEEMRLVSVALLKILQDDAPSMFDDFRIDTAIDGNPFVRAVELGD